MLAGFFLIILVVAVLAYCYSWRQHWYRAQRKIIAEVIGKPESAIQMANRMSGKDKLAFNMLYGKEVNAELRLRAKQLFACQKMEDNVFFRKLQVAAEEYGVRVESSPARYLS